MSKKYIVLERFADLQDGKRIYDAGETFPRVGLEVSEDRLVELAGGSNNAQRPLIKEVTTHEAKAEIKAETSVTEVQEKEEVKPAPKQEKVVRPTASKPKARKASKKNA